MKLFLDLGMQDKGARVEMINEICGDERFTIIAKAKEALLESTNIETSPEEMAVLDDFLFRCWQMGWLDKYEVPRMTVRDMISRLRTQETVLIRDETNYNIGIFDSDSRGLEPYMDRSVGDWFPGCPPGSMGVDFVIMLGGDSDNA